MMSAIMFGLNILWIGFCIGMILTVIVVILAIPFIVYSIPYCIWVGSQNCKGQHLDKKKEGFFTVLKNATKLYISWFNKRKPT